MVGYGEKEMLLASDLPALLPYTRQVAYLADGELVLLTRKDARYSLLDGTKVIKAPYHVPYDALSTAKGEYKHFMLKEINEQPEAVMNALRGRSRFDTPHGGAGGATLLQGGGPEHRPGRLGGHGDQLPRRHGGP